MIGPSGGGKSTLLRCMTLLERLDGGGLWYGGFSAGEDGEIAVARPAGGDRGDARNTRQGHVLRQARKTNFGLVFQNYNLFPHIQRAHNIMDAPLCVQKRDQARKWSVRRAT